MPVTLTEGDVHELRQLLLGLHQNPFEQAEVRMMGGLRAVLGRELLAKLRVHVPDDPRAGLLYTPPAQQAAPEGASRPMTRTRQPKGGAAAHAGEELAGSLPESACCAGGVDARRDVLERRVLAQGATLEEWAVEVSQIVEGVWTTTFYVGVQGFRLAGGDSDHSEEHCMFIGRMFVKALDRLLTALEEVERDVNALQRVILRANDQLIDSRVDDPQHQVDCHADTLPQVFLKLAAGHEAAIEALQTVIREWVEPESGVTQQEMLETGIGMHLGDPAADMRTAMQETNVRWGVWLTTQHWVAVFGGHDWTGTRDQAEARSARWEAECRLMPLGAAYAGPPKVSYEVRPYTGNDPASDEELAMEEAEFRRSAEGSR